MRRYRSEMLQAIAVLSETNGNAAYYLGTTELLVISEVDEPRLTTLGDFRGLFELLIL